MNELSAEIGTYNQLRQQAAKYPSLVAMVDIIEQRPWIDFDPWKATPVRQSPVETRPMHITQPPVLSSLNKYSKLFNVLYNNTIDVLVILKAEQGLEDLALVKGWKIIRHALYEYELRPYLKIATKINNYQDFVDVYLQDEIEPEDTSLFNDLIVSYYADKQDHNIDPDEEDFDEFFEPDQEETTNTETF